MIKKIINKIKQTGLLSLIIKILSYPFGSKRRKIYKKMLEKSDIAEKFNDIYENNLWSSTESGSGEGSEIAFTEPLRNWLVNNLSKFKINHFVDASCGDYNWMKLVVPKLKLQYLGLDIVKNVVDKNRELYASDTVRFEVADICIDKLPTCDLIMIRDCLFHLSYNDINKLLKNLESTEYKYLLTTTHSPENNFVNKDIVTGDFRLIDLFSKPLNFNEQFITERIRDYPNGYPIKREMILIEKKYVPTELLIY